MKKFLAILSLLLLSLSFNHPSEERSSSSPSPQGDTRMGADAAASGTDVTDKEIQAQEDKGRMNSSQEIPTKEEMEKEDAERPIR